MHSTPDRTIAIPSPRTDMTDAELCVYSADGGETAEMILRASGQTIAHGAGFRVAECGRWTWLDMPPAELSSTFGAFMAHAVESSETDARDGWPTLTDAASDWTDALALLGEIEPEPDTFDAIETGPSMPDVEFWAESTDYAAAVSACKTRCAELERDGYAVEYGWAAEGNYWAARATKGPDVRYVAVERIEL